MKARLLVLAAIALAGCPKSNEATTTDAGAASSASAAASASASAAASASPAASASAAASASPAAWSVKYTLALGTMYIPDTKDWSNTKQFKNDPEKYLGEGTIALTVDPTGRVAGTSEGGPLGDAILDGRLLGEELTATVRRKDPTDHGLTGTLAATVKGGSLEGSMKLADTNAAVVREAKISGTKAK